MRIGEHIEISPLIKKKVKPKGSTVSDHLLLCNHSPFFENFSILTKVVLISFSTLKKC